jgi:hypothetical protein
MAGAARDLQIVTCGVRRSLFLHCESELPTLFGPGERHGTQEPLESQGAGLPAFGDGFHDVRREERKPKDAPDVSFTEIVFARNLGRIGIVAPS